MRRIFVMLSVLALGGCGLLKGPITGQLENGSETFTGAMSEEINGQGTIALKTSTGATCDGTFFHNLYAKENEIATADGIMKCSDGRTGTFHFAGGLGSGDLGGQRITITFAH